ncbi:hypothetical protein FACS1894109_10860 [Spirochaetia bacterium]|nr:hypothetical protein FACS1894109_10860 [Spirochaetia bacterium]
MKRVFFSCLSAACLLVVCLLTACENFDLPLEPYIRAQTSPAPSPDKVITLFVITGPAAAVGDVDEAARTVTVNVPYGTDVTGMTTFITHTGASISPGSGAPQDFTNPVPYTVTAADGSQAAYTVTVNVGTLTSKEITAFSVKDTVTNIWYAGVVNEAAKTVAIDVPYGTSLTNMDTAISHTGASVSPASGTAQTFVSGTAVPYTVTAVDGSTETYQVTVNFSSTPSGNAKAITAFIVKASGTTMWYAGVVNETAKTVAIDVPYGTNLANMDTVISHTGASVSPASGATQTFTSGAAVPYTVTAVDGSTQAYQVTVNFSSTPSSDAKAITAFIVKDSVTNLWYAGVVNEAASPKTVTIDVPYGTNLTNMGTAISHTGDSVSPASGAAQTFTNGTAVPYTVTPVSGSPETYQVRVNFFSTPSSDAREITAFIVKDTGTNLWYAGDVDNTVSPKTVTIDVPYGTNLANMDTAITHTGASIASTDANSGRGGGAGLPATFTGANFTTPVRYTVTAVDGSTQAYDVTVNEALASDKMITSFTLAGKAGTITNNADDTTGTITVTVPYGTDRTSMSGSVSHTGASIAYPGGTTAAFTDVNFSSPVDFIITAADDSPRTYTVTATPANLLSVTITGYKPTYKIGESFNNAMGTVTGIDNAGNTISTISLNTCDISGFDNTTAGTQTITLTAPETSIRTTFTVTVLSDSKAITAFSVGTYWGVIDELNHTVVVTVPSGTSLNPMTAIVNHTGASIKLNSEEPITTASPVTFNPVNFSASSQTFTVTAADDSPQAYTVTITAGTLTVAINGPTPLRVGQTLTANPSDPYVRYQWQWYDPSDGSVTEIDGATSATYLLKGDDMGKYINVKIINATGGDVTSAVIGEVKYGIAVPSSPDLTVKLGIRTSEEPLTSGMVTNAFTSLHKLISSPEGSEDFKTIIHTGDYIDLAGLTVARYHTGTEAADGTDTDSDTNLENGAINATNVELGGGHGWLLRLIVVGINSFNGKNGNNTPHVVFQFQNVPGTHRMNGTNTNSGGYWGSEMRNYLAAPDGSGAGGYFLTGLTNAGVPDSVLWAPSRRVWNGVATAETIVDKLFLPTEWEMFGSQSNSHATETATNQAWLEYYASPASRIKYDSSDAANWYWLASPAASSTTHFTNVDPGGGGSSNYASSVGGVAPAFCVK